MRFGRLPHGEVAIDVDFLDARFRVVDKGKKSGVVLLHRAVFSGLASSD
jgi:hypothetical protein